MTTANQQAAILRAAFDTIEEAYEFMLAYAAQGRKDEALEGKSGGESQIRQYLVRFREALDGLQDATASGLGGPDGADFCGRFVSDLSTVRSVLGLLLAQPSISSDMVDNTASLVAMRAFLTDVFFIDQVALPPR